MDDDPGDCCECKRCNPTIISYYKVYEYSIVPNHWGEVVIDMAYITVDNLTYWHTGKFR